MKSKVSQNYVVTKVILYMPMPKGLKFFTNFSMFFVAYFNSPCLCLRYKSKN